jgi:hypothetical protein
MRTDHVSIIKIKIFRCPWLYSSTMQAYKPTKRRKKNTMHEDDADAAEFVTHRNETFTNKAGKKRSKKVKIPLFPQASGSGQTPTASASQIPEDYVPNDVDMPEDVPMVGPKPRKVSIDWCQVPRNIIN